jgi:tRNA uridine 5-carboxymethylaminomethyl modification enzyme
MLLSCDPDLHPATPEAMGQAELAIKYDGYIRRQEEEARKLKKYEGMLFSHDFPFATVRGLSAEVRDKLARVRPVSLGQAQRVPGVTPAAIALLLVLLRRREAGTLPGGSLGESAG